MTLIKTINEIDRTGETAFQQINSIFLMKAIILTEEYMYKTAVQAVSKNLCHYSWHYLQKSLREILTILP